MPGGSWMIKSLFVALVVLPMVANEEYRSTNQISKLIGATKGPIVKMSRLSRNFPPKLFGVASPSYVQY